LAVLVAYGWWFTDRLPFSGGALLAMFGAAAGLIVLGSVHRSSAQHHGRDEATLRAPALRWSVIAWSATVTALTAWELLALFSHPRSEHPTISSLLPGGVALLRAGMRNRLARFLVLAGWVWLGWHFFVRTSR
jgi:hypothetical protein